MFSLFWSLVKGVRVISFGVSKQSLVSVEHVLSRALRQVPSVKTQKQKDKSKSDSEYKSELNILCRAVAGLCANTY